MRAQNLLADECVSLKAGPWAASHTCCVAIIDAVPLPPPPAIVFSLLFPAVTAGWAGALSPTTGCCFFRDDLWSCIGEATVKA